MTPQRNDAMAAKGNGVGGPPDLSIITAVWNGARYLREAIASVQAQQTRFRWELLLVDDGSQDESLPIALRAAAQDPHRRIHVLRHPGGANRGSSVSRNLALRHARGAVVAFLDADDLWLPHCIEFQMTQLHRHPEVAMVYAAAERWCDHATPFQEQQARAAWWGSNYIPPVVPPGCAAGVLLPPQLVAWFLEDESMVPCICSVAVRTAVARLVGGFDEQFHGLYDDQTFHAKIALKSRVYASAECVARYRQHPSSLCADGRMDAGKQRAARAQFLRWLADYRQAQTRGHCASHQGRIALRPAPESDDRMALEPSLHTAL